jgi:NAD(P)-dependent dehydrogenase (short-subunit alcohol dehydrogenase family)
MEVTVVDVREVEHVRRKVALVTGASRGIGAEIAHALAARGCHVAITARSATGLDTVANDIRASGGSVDVFPADLVEPGATAPLVRSIINTHGSIDILISCAGVLSEASLANLTDAALTQSLELNLMAPARLTREVAFAMMNKSAGRIVYVASMFAQVSARGYAAYSASKAGLIGFTTSVAIELAPSGIQVNTIAPGHVRTDMIRHLLTTADAEAQFTRRTPAKRVAEPEEIASVAVFLALDAPPFLTGEVIRVDGGYACQ